MANPVTCLKLRCVISSPKRSLRELQDCAYALVRELRLSGITTSYVMKSLNGTAVLELALLVVSPVSFSNLRHLTAHIELLLRKTSVTAKSWEYNNQYEELSSNHPAQWERF